MKVGFHFRKKKFCTSKLIDYYVGIFEPVPTYGVVCSLAHNLNHYGWNASMHLVLTLIPNNKRTVTE